MQKVKDEMLDEFLKYVLDSIGNISSRRITEKYLAKRPELLSWFNEQKLKFAEYSDRDVIILLQHGYISPPKCYCGNNAKVQAYGKIRTFDYCSKECSWNSPSRIKKLVASKKNQDHSIANKKREETMLAKYGNKFNSQRPEIKSVISEKTSKRYLSDDILSKLTDKEWLYEEYITKKKSALEIGGELNVYYGTVIEYLKKFGFEIRYYSNSSKEEHQIADFLSDNNIEFISNDRKTIGKELDFYIPEYDLAIELNGLYYHSYNHLENKTEKERHLTKTNMCVESGIQLLHFTDSQWNTKQEIVKSMILNKCQKSIKIAARKCIISEIDTKEAREFFDKNHIQGFYGAACYLGLKYSNELISCVAIGKPRYNKNYDYELIRSATKIGYNVIGGFSKLLKHFKKNNLGSIISYADRFYSSGDVYIKNGFKLLKTTDIGYFYTDKYSIFNRVSFQKSRLKEKLKNFDEKLSESENMFNNGYRRFWDCGQLVFVL